jgi:hypothetical protein
MICLRKHEGEAKVELQNIRNPAVGGGLNVLVKNHARKRPLQRHMRRFGDNIKMLKTQGSILWNRFQWFKIRISGGCL